LIWFNPDEKAYHSGARVDLEVQMSLSRNRDQFDVLDRLEDANPRLAEKIVNRLNKAYEVY